MQVLGDHTATSLADALRESGVRIHVGPYIYEIKSRLPQISNGLMQLYANYALASNDGFADFHIALRPSDTIQRLRRKIDFFFDNHRPFNRIENRHAYPFLEWGMNWCVSVCANEYLKLHAAVVSKNDVALILPGLPGSGKSTLCAALALDGWRVLSDEHALVPLHSADVVPLCRPISLKNESIDVIRARAKDVSFGPQTSETHKGDVVHMQGDMHPQSHDTGPVPARFLVFPQFEQGADLKLWERPRAESFVFAAHHSFNYEILGVTGFNTLTQLLDSVQCMNFTYGNLDAAVEVLNDLIDGRLGK